jgi:hypothetical protein
MSPEAPRNRRRLPWPAIAIGLALAAAVIALAAAMRPSRAEIADRIKHKREAEKILKPYLERKSEGDRTPEKAD